MSSIFNLFNKKKPKNMWSEPTFRLSAVKRDGKYLLFINDTKEHEFDIDSLVGTIELSKSQFKQVLNAGAEDIATTARLLSL